jgi:hypothetical protein
LSNEKKIEREREEGGGREGSEACGEGEENEERKRKIRNIIIKIEG